MNQVAKWLVTIGALNWGLVGLGRLLGMGDSLNVVNLILGRVSVLESLVYLLVGVSAVYLLVTGRQ